MTKAANDNYVDRTLACRHEIKYLISESTAAACRQFIAPYTRMDRYSELQENGAYPIVSLYCDSPDLKLYHESSDGKKNRFKLRIRSYSDNLDYPRFFEIKRRVNTIIVKSRARVMHRSIAPLMEGTMPPPMGDSKEDEALRQFILYKNSINARGVVKIRYLRQAYECDYDDRVRITFDRELCGNVTDRPEVELHGFGWYRLPLKAVILEIKFTGQFPPWIARMCKCLGIKQQSVSKYTSCINQACLLKYCAPKLPY